MIPRPSPVPRLYCEAGTMRVCTDSGGSASTPGSAQEGRFGFRAKGTAQYEKRASARTRQKHWTALPGERTRAGQALTTVHVSTYSNNCAQQLCSATALCNWHEDDEE